MSYYQGLLDRIIKPEHWPPFRMYFRYATCDMDVMTALVASSFVSLPDASVLGMADDGLYLPWDERMEAE